MQDVVIENQFQQEIIGIVAKSCNLLPETIAPDSSFESLGISSLDALTIAFELEERYSIEIPDVDVYSISDIKQLVEGVEKLLCTDTNPV